MKKFLVFCLLLGSLLQSSLTLAGHYYIELVVFKNNHAGSSSEIWNNDLAPLKTARAVEPTRSNPARGVIPVSKLRNSPDYTLLTHVSWGQSAPIRSNMTPRYIHADIPGYSLSGTVSFYQARFLFVDVDLRLEDRRNGQVYQLKQHKRVKPKEMHYFDHPVFGAVLYVQRSGEQ